MKAQILAALGENELGRAAQVDAALAANDRLKYYLSLLQMAAARGDRPKQATSALHGERLACGVAESWLDDVVGATQREADGYRVPGCAKILGSITQELRVMAEPVLAANPAPFAGRFESVVRHLPAPNNGLISGASIRELTRAADGQHDSLHQLVMDLHKRLNAMQAELAEQRLDGAAVYHIEPADRPLVAAFMAGVNRTAPLKFDHPGLATTATHAGQKLIIQNDIGETDAHVVVIHIEGLSVQITYTDVHPERAQFFRGMLKNYPVSWNADRSGKLAGAGPDASFTLVSGTFNAGSQTELEEYLGFLGSRLVFLIDWNRARKQLRGFLRGADRDAVLAWAAEAEVGHRGFLKLGGARIINQAIEKVAGSAFHFGDRLCDVLGTRAANDFVRFVLRAATEGLKQQQSARLIEDRVCAELQAHLSSEGERLLQLAGEHAGIVFELATLMRDGVRDISASEGGANYEKLARRARAFEHDADQLVIAAREAVAKRPEYAAVFRVAETADDAADELEEVVFLLGLLQASKPNGEALHKLAGLANLLVEASQEWVKALTHAVHVRKAGQQEDAGDFLLAVDRLLALEHEADDAERALTYASVRHARNFRQLHLYSEIGGSLEAAADSLKSAGLIARDYLFATVLGA
jgi:uncharacterized protein Yka (UPF0111/DUF47 family)